MNLSVAHGVRALLLPFWLAVALSPALHAEPLRAKDQVLFMPGVARVVEGGQLEIDVHAWLYEKERMHGVNSLLSRYLKIDVQRLSRAARTRFDQRTGLFHTESSDERVIDIVVDATGLQIALPPTADNGRTNMRLLIDAPSPRPDEDVVRFHALTAPGDTRRFNGQAIVVPPVGLSVVSDIDDTIKHTHVRNTHEMMLNTFTRRFDPVPGMAPMYRTLAGEPGTRFHYVSASPIQLFPPLAEFLRAGDFPVGSVHLRESTTWRSLLPGKGASRAHKLAVIEQLMADFPQRRFLLVGDSGEADPEIYAELARKHPALVEAIVIRDVTQEGRESPRYFATFDGVDPARWHVLVDGDAWPVPAR
ncbi:App1 family protein [Variovorax sp. dw_954]|uniref:phosphatidate phosphatase App1 family protein n=1 Tax=Variovorax sp. dw_954 TaxID=2720078 RepID=UPI001BD340A7|nr:App1 family protein [Variovorax sp. dw_954]